VCTETDTICSAKNVKLVTKNHEEGSRTCSEHGCRFHQTLGLRTVLFRLCHSLLLQNSPGLHASSAQPAGSDARDSGTWVLNVAPKPLSPLPSPSLPACCAVSPSRVVQLSRKRRLRRCMSLTVAAMHRFFPVPARHMRSVPVQLRNHDRVSVPRLRRVAATIVDPDARCFNYSLSLGRFR
jgi:hypothetical protein